MRVVSEVQQEPLSTSQSETPKYREYQRAKSTVVADDHDVVMDDILMVELKPQQ
jgi:hypothetical protein